MSSDSYTQAKHALASLGEALGFEDLCFDEEDKNCLLEIDEKLEVNITFVEDTNEVIVHHLVGKLPDEGRCDVVEELLEANLFWSGTRGATFSIERATGDVFIARTFAIKNLTGVELGAAVIALVDIADYWREILN